MPTVSVDVDVDLDDFDTDDLLDELDRRRADRDDPNRREDAEDEREDHLHAGLRGRLLGPLLALGPQRVRLDAQGSGDARAELVGLHQHRHEVGEADVVDVAHAAHHLVEDALALRRDEGLDAQRLDALYEYMCMRLLHANLRNDKAALTEVASLLGEIKGAWEEIADDPAALSANKAAA